MGEVEDLPDERFGDKLVGWYSPHSNEDVYHMSEECEYASDRARPVSERFVEWHGLDMCDHCSGVVPKEDTDKYGRDPRYYLNNDN